MANEAILNRSKLHAALMARGVKMLDDGVPDYRDNDPAGEGRGRGWYYQTEAGSWVFLGASFEEAQTEAVKGKMAVGIVGTPPKALQRTWVDVGLAFAVPVAVPLAVGAVTGMLRKDGKELEAGLVDTAAALAGAALMEKGTTEAMRRNGAALLGGAAADVGNEYLSGPLRDLKNALFGDKQAKNDLARLDEAERAAQARAQDESKRQEQEQQQTVTQAATAKS